MADPLSITASVLAVINAAVLSTKSLYEAISRFKVRDKTLRRLQSELQDLTRILDSLKQVADAEAAMLELLQGPIDRCSQVCHEFEESMESFWRKSKTGIRDWTKMEFMRGDINEFIDIISGYKSTISVGLGTITIHTAKVSQQVLKDYNEMIQDTVYNLEVHLHRIDEKMARFAMDEISASDSSIGLKDEKEVTQQCLRICEDARSYIESLSNRESSLLQEGPQNVNDDGQSYFEAQLLTRQALDKNRNSFAAIIDQLRTRLESLVLKNDPGDENERSRLLNDINTSKQCLEVCKVASEVSTQKIYRIGEVIADGESDQVVVTTLADLFDIKKALSQGNSAQLVGSMSEDALLHLAEKRYASRFGALPQKPGYIEAVSTRVPLVNQTTNDGHAFPTQTAYDEQCPGPRTSPNRPSSNEVRKRSTRDEMGKSACQ
ncbi:uncharacterized protein N7482_005000 [Penicillium canariense]|uniref:Azaphilone pigments biosynthesis cluster protein L N-terminal domain-containing protein n=1 Tax=Penicillium canariense TaxID=189055 RepID=A0A9W9I459_9EURO|nr:uncharacterized protein N7482_005000 [Penicillium canariense]KAJ5166219.1 hypothetical protein N7482_005000 [Penicillium canariense]